MFSFILYLIRKFEIESELGDRQDPVCEVFELALTAAESEFTVIILANTDRTLVCFYRALHKPGERCQNG